MKAVTGLAAAAAVFTADSRPSATVTDDDMAKLVDALEQHLDGGVTGTRGSSSGSTEDEETCSEDEDDERDGHDKAMIALDEAAAVGIQVGHALTQAGSLLRLS